jgi:hypothetical protein
MYSRNSRNNIGFFQCGHFRISSFIALLSITIAFRCFLTMPRAAHTQQPACLDKWTAVSHQRGIPAHSLYTALSSRDSITYLILRCASDRLLVVFYLWWHCRPTPPRQISLPRQPESIENTDLHDEWPSGAMSGMKASARSVTRRDGHTTYARSQFRHQLMLNHYHRCIFLCVAWYSLRMPMKFLGNSICH